MSRRFQPSRTSATPAPSPVRWALAGSVLGVLAGLLWFAPARWLCNALETASAGHLQFSNTRGSIWQGSAQLSLSGGPGSRDASGLPGRVHWRLQPKLSGLQPQLQAQVQADCCMPQPLRLQLGARWGGWQLDIDPGQSEWSAALLAGLGTPWNTVQPEGVLQIQHQQVRIESRAQRLRWSGQVALEANQLSSRLSTLKPMGSYRLTWQAGAAINTSIGPATQSPSLDLQTQAGDLRLSGHGEWVGGRLRFAGEASAAPGREAALANLLNIIGRRNGARSIITIG